jgi:adenylosuccinate lyase
MDDLRKWAELHAPLGHVQAKQVLELLAKLKAAELLAKCSAERVAELEKAIGVCVPSIIRCYLK